MLVVALHAALALTMPQLRGHVVASRPRLPLPRPVAGAPLATINDNRTPAGRLSNGTLTVALDVVEAAWQPEGPEDPTVRVLAFAEAGGPPMVPAPLIRAPAGTNVRLTLRNRSDSALTLSGFRPWRKLTDDTVQLAAGATRELTFRLDSVGNYFYTGILKRLRQWRDRDWLDSQLTGALIVDPVTRARPGSAVASARDRVWVVTEWFRGYPDRPFESALVFNGKAWPHTERLTMTQNDSVHWRMINVAAIEHPMHLHGFYFRVTRRGGERADTAIARARQPLQNVQLMQQGGTMSISFVPTTPGNWVFHCHFADHVSSEVSLRDSPDTHRHPMTGAPALASAGGGRDSTATASTAAAHSMHGLVIGMRVTPAPGYREPAVAERRTIRLFAQKEPNRLIGSQDAYGFALQRGDSAPPPDRVELPGPLLELRRGAPVRIVVKNNLDEPTGVHWHGLEIESYPDGVPGVTGMGTRITPPIAPGDSFAAEFTPPRSGTFPYHAHLHELAQIGAGMYGAIVVTDAPRDTTRDHVVVAGGGGVQVFEKEPSPWLRVNGRSTPAPIRLTAGVANRLRLVSIHTQTILRFRLMSDSSVVRWRALAKDGADLPPALRTTGLAMIELGPGETADFEITPATPSALTMEVYGWPVGLRVALPVEIVRRR